MKYNIFHTGDSKNHELAQLTDIGWPILKIQVLPYFSQDSKKYIYTFRKVLFYMGEIGFSKDNRG